MDFIHRNEVSDLIDMDTLPILKYLGIIDDIVVFIIFKLLSVLWGTNVIFIMYENDITKIVFIYLRLMIMCN